ncbi:HET-domain-containing protein, partial [Lentithecium fluviatile CBS 122367]
MRLINASSIRLETFNDESKIPPYAILSHTWGNSEVTFQDLSSLVTSKRRSHVLSSTGYYKIVKTCEQALSEGLAYAWVDTCCIDKTSSSELSEAINSMFRWYKKAEACYAYLDDIDVIFWDKSIDLIDEKDLAKARWFTRGWTLQELIAPRKVVFYIKGWKCVGNKSSMKAKLARITGVNERSLTGFLPNVRVAERMSWAAGRETTKGEDMAYCLMGIFDVNMPLMYGEGGEKAFIRLQEEIMKDSDDQSLFAW